MSQKKARFLRAFLLLVDVYIALIAIKDIAKKRNKFKSASLDGQR
jgi:hypothetical protein